MRAALRPKRDLAPGRWVHVQAQGSVETFRGVDCESNSLANLNLLDGLGLRRRDGVLRDLDTGLNFASRFTG